MKKPLFAALAMSMSMLCHAQAEPAPTPVNPLNAYKVKTRFAGFVCEIKGTTYLRTLKDSDNPAGCLEGANQDAVALFRDAAATLSGKPLEALKNFHIAHLAYMNSIPPDLSEGVRPYEARVRAFKNKSDEEWARLQIEIQLNN